MDAHHAGPPRIQGGVRYAGKVGFHVFPFPKIHCVLHCSFSEKAAGPPHPFNETIIAEKALPRKGKKVKMSAEAVKMSSGKAPVYRTPWLRPFPAKIGTRCRNHDEGQRG